MNTECDMQLFETMSMCSLLYRIQVASSAPKGKRISAKVDLKSVSGKWHCRLCRDKTLSSWLQGSAHTSITPTESKQLASNDRSMVTIIGHFLFLWISSQTLILPGQMAYRRWTRRQKMVLFCWFNFIYCCTRLMGRMFFIIGR